MKYKGLQEDTEKAILAISDEEFDAEYINKIKSNAVYEEEFYKKQIIEAMKKADESLE